MHLRHLLGGGNRHRNVSRCDAPEWRQLAWNRHNNLTSNPFNGVIHEHGETKEGSTVRFLQSLQAISCIVLLKSGFGLIQSVPPEPRKSPSRQSIEPCAEHRSCAVKPHFQGRSQKNIAEEIPETVIAKIRASSWFQYSANLTHCQRLICVGNGDRANESIKRLCSKRHGLRARQYDRQTTSPTFRERIGVYVQTNPDAAALHQLFQFHTIAAANIDHTRPSWELGADL